MFQPFKLVSDFEKRFEHFERLERFEPNSLNNQRRDLWLTNRVLPLVFRIIRVVALLSMARSVSKVTSSTSTLSLFPPASGTTNFFTANGMSANVRQQVSCERWKRDSGSSRFRFSSNAGRARETSIIVKAN